MEQYKQEHIYRQYYFKKVRYEESEIEFEDEVDLLMSSDIVSAQISTKPITFATVQSGWFFKEDRKLIIDKIKSYNKKLIILRRMKFLTNQLFLRFRPNSKCAHNRNMCST